MASKPLTHAQRVAANIAAHTSTLAQRQANIAAHQSTTQRRLANQTAHTSTPAQRAANVAAHRPPVTKTPGPKKPTTSAAPSIPAATAGQLKATAPKVPVVKTAPKAPVVKTPLTPAQVAHQAAVAKNQAAHTATPAQENANRKAHGLAPLPPPAAPKSTVPAGYHAVAVPDPLQDQDYKYQRNLLANQQAQYTTQKNHGLAQYAQNYNTQVSDLGYGPSGWDSHNLTAGTYGAAMRDTSNDFSTRGMAYSTPAVTAQTNMANDYANRLTKLRNMNAQNTTTVNDAANVYQTSNQDQLATARRGAVSRIAGQLGIQPTQVTAGKPTTVNVKNP